LVVLNVEAVVSG